MRLLNHPTCFALRSGRAPLGVKADRLSEQRRSKPATISHYSASTRPPLLNPRGLRSFMLVGVKHNFTSTGGSSRRETVLRLSVRLSTGKRSITGQIVVALQRRLGVASPSAQSAKGNLCN